MILDIVHRTGLYPTDPEERDLEIRFPNPLPEEPLERLQEAQIKKELGVSTERILDELGYDVPGFLAAD
jgi:hypothetical protein